jgi:serralysin
MCILCSLLGLPSGSGSSASIHIAGGASSDPAVGGSGSGNPAAAVSGTTNTGNVFIDVLAYRSWFEVGGDRNITYYFDETSPYHLWTAGEKAIWRSAMQEWVNVANITAQEVFSPSGADIVETWTNPTTLTTQFGLDPNGQPWVAAHFLPQVGGGALGEYDNLYLLTAYTQSSLTPGGYGYWTFFHEIGHGLGLSHPHGMVQLVGEPFFPGVNGSGDLGDFSYNQMVYSAMSYNRGAYMAPSTLSSNTYGLPATPMAFDIAAIQYFYGPNTTYRNGSDTYVLPDVNEPGTVWQCIWDTGGLDTIQYNGKLNTTIDLRPASLVFGDPIAGGAISRVNDIYGGFTIANGVVIERAIGGSGNDTIIGNSADNAIDGRAGNDAVVYSGARSAYTITDLGGGTVRVTGPDGSDTISNVERLVFSDTTVTLTPSPPPPTGVTVSSSAWIPTGLGDFDGDGRSDFLWQTDGAKLAIWKMDGFQINAADYTRLGSSEVGLPGADWHIAGTADFDGDHKADILWRTDGGLAAIWEMDGTHIKAADYTRLGSSAVGAPGADWQQLGAADFGGDGKADILWHTDGGALAIWEMDGTQIKSADYIRLGSTAVGVPAPDWKIVGVGDFDGDGHNDLLWETGGGTLAVWTMNGTHIKSADYLRIGGSTVGIPGADWHVADVGDFDGDHKADILWRVGAPTPANGSVPGGGQLAIWEMNGNQIKTADYVRSGSTATGAPGNDWHLLGSADHNGDGMNDILWRTDAGQLAIWDMNGTHITAADYTRIGATSVGAPGADWHLSQHQYELV